MFYVMVQSTHPDDIGEWRFLYHTRFTSPGAAHDYVASTGTHPQYQVFELVPAPSIAIGTPQHPGEHLHTPASNRPTQAILEAMEAHPHGEQYPQ